MNCIKTLVFTTATTLFVASASVSADFNSHVGVNVEDGQITTWNWISGEGGYINPSRVFAFQQDDAFGPTAFDFATNSTGGTFATPGELGFNFLSQLSVWNGGGFSQVNDTVFTLGFGPASATTDTGFVEGFATNVRDENSHPNNESQWGRHHMHYNTGTELSALGGGSVADGVYMVEMEWWYQPLGDNTTQYQNSDSFYVLLSLNADDQVADARMFLESQLPAPGALALLAMGGLVGTRRRRA